MKGLIEIDGTQHEYTECRKTKEYSSRWEDVVYLGFSKDTGYHYWWSTLQHKTQEEIARHKAFFGN